MNDDRLEIQSPPDHTEVAAPQPEIGSVWDRLRKKKIPIETIVPKDIFSSNAPHYFEITNFKTAEVTCRSCPVRHGGYLEAHLLTRYRVTDGVIYLDNKPMTHAPQKTT